MIECSDQAGAEQVQNRDFLFGREPVIDLICHKCALLFERRQRLPLKQQRPQSGRRMRDSLGAYTPSHSRWHPVAWAALRFFTRST